jgi:hypothetical protein
MKKVVTVSLGNSPAGLHVSTPISSAHSFEVQRLGAGQRHGQGLGADAPSASQLQTLSAWARWADHYHVGQGTPASTKKHSVLLNVVTRVPATTGSHAAAPCCKCVRCAMCKNEFGALLQNNNLVLFMSGMRKLRHGRGPCPDYTPNLKFADALAQTGTPAMLTSLMQLELYAKGSDWALSGRPRRNAGSSPG